MFARGEDLWSQVPAYPESDQKSFPFLHVVPILQKQRGAALADAAVGRKWPRGARASCLIWSLVVVSFM